jgi:hypothetical protein
MTDLTSQERLIITKYDLLFESRLTKVETTMDNIQKNMDAMQKSMDQNFKDLKTDYKWILRIMLGLSSSLFGLMAHGFHWF